MANLCAGIEMHVGMLKGKLFKNGELDRAWQDYQAFLGRTGGACRSKAKTKKHPAVVFYAGSKLQWFCVTNERRSCSVFLGTR